VSPFLSEDLLAPRSSRTFLYFCKFRTSFFDRSVRGKFVTLTPIGLSFIRPL